MILNLEPWAMNLQQLVVCAPARDIHSSAVCVAAGGIRQSAVCVAAGDIQHSAVSVVAWDIQQLIVCAAARDVQQSAVWVAAGNIQQSAVCVAELQASSLMLQVSSGSKLQASSFKLQASNFKLQASSFKLQASSFKLQASSFKLQASSFTTQHNTTQHNTTQLVLVSIFNVFCSCPCFICVSHFFCLECWAVYKLILISYLFPSAIASLYMLGLYLLCLGVRTFLLWVPEYNSQFRIPSWGFQERSFSESYLRAFIKFSKVVSEESSPNKLSERVLR